MDEVKPKLLLADHSPTIRKVVELTFQEEGVDVTTASDAQSAMELFVAVQPDIVLVDVSLKGTSGYQICEMIKNDEATAQIPVLLLVGSFEPFDRDEAERVRADGFLTKPFHSVRDLVARVSDLLGRSADTGAVAAPPAAVITQDIDQLYNSSFGAVDDRDDLDTADDLLGDAGMDDELIETTYPSEPLEDDILAFETTDEIPEAERSFDWSDEAVVTDSQPVQKAQTNFEPKFVFTEDGDNDFSQEESANADTIENMSLAREIAEDDTVEGLPSGDEHLDTDTGNEPGSGISEARDYTIESLPAEYHDAPEDTIENLPAEYHDVQDDTIEDLGPVDAVSDNTIEAAPRTSVDPRPNEPSPEFIELVVQRVIERLSDSVVREIAEDAVPRVAERIIREALSQDKKS